jgi:predicted nucleotide-binding protein
MNDNEKEIQNTEVSHSFHYDPYSDPVVILWNNTFREFAQTASAAVSAVYSRINQSSSGLNADAVFTQVLSSYLAGKRGEMIEDAERCAYKRWRERQELNRLGIIPQNQYLFNPIDNHILSEKCKSIASEMVILIQNTAAKTSVNTGGVLSSYALTEMSKVGVQYAEKYANFVISEHEIQYSRWYSEQIVGAENYSDNEVGITAMGSKVFIVHGHDNEAKLEVARFIEQLKLSPIILHERPNSGQTLIEKIETNSDVGFAVILYTPCDVGRAKTEEKYNERARQNVVFEHGYFIAKLGRENVCVLLKDGVEKPSDIDGVVYEPMDTSGGWKLVLARELKSAGYAVDMNLLAV